jgi:hypothetical protein
VLSRSKLSRICQRFLCRFGFHSLAGNGSPDLRGFGAGVAKLRSAEKSRKCADVSRSRPHLRMQSGDPMWRRMAPHRSSVCAVRDCGVLSCPPTRKFERATMLELPLKPLWHIHFVSVSLFIFPVNLSFIFAALSFCPCVGLGKLFCRFWS